MNGSSVSSIQSASVTPAMEDVPKRGGSVGGTIAIVIVSLLAATFVGLSVWLYLEWQEAQSNLDGKIGIAVAEARREVADTLEEDFAERQKIPHLEFTGPDDYGRLSFYYPRTWSVYIAKDAQRGGDFEAYFNPIVVWPVSTTTINALRVTIYDRQIDDVRRNFDSLVKNGKLTQTVFQVGERTGDRYDGAFSNDITGSAVLLKINDKTAFIRTDSVAGRPDFETLIQTIKFN